MFGSLRGRRVLDVPLPANKNDARNGDTDDPSITVTCTSDSFVADVVEPVRPTKVTIENTVPPIPPPPSNPVPEDVFSGEPSENDDGHDVDNGLSAALDQVSIDNGGSARTTTTSDPATGGVPLPPSLLGLGSETSAQSADDMDTSTIASSIPDIQQADYSNYPTQEAAEEMPQETRTVDSVLHASMFSANQADTFHDTLKHEIRKAIMQTLVNTIIENEYTEPEIIGASGHRPPQHRNQVIDTFIQQNKSIIMTIIREVMDSTFAEFVDDNNFKDIVFGHNKLISHQINTPYKYIRDGVVTRVMLCRRADMVPNQYASFKRLTPSKAKKEKCYGLNFPEELMLATNSYSGGVRDSESRVSNTHSMFVPDMNV